MIWLAVCFVLIILIVLGSDAHWSISTFFATLLFAWIAFPIWATLYR